MPYETTKVPVSRSQEQIRALLRKHSAARIAFGESYDDAAGTGQAGVEFVHLDVLVRIYVPVRRPSASEAIERNRASGRRQSQAKAVENAMENEECRIWRVLHWSIKARMEAVEAGIETFEQAFLAHVVDPSSGRTLWSIIEPAVKAGAFQVGGAGLKALGAGS